MIIRSFHREDTDNVISLWKRCNLLVSWNNPRLDIERKLKVNPDLFVVGEIDEKIIATAMGGYEGHRGWINYLAVAPEYRRKGLAKRVVQYLENKLKELGCPKINIQVRASNQEVIKFYDGIGYNKEELINFGKRLIEDGDYDI